MWLPQVGSRIYNAISNDFDRVSRLFYVLQTFLWLVFGLGIDTHARSVYNSRVSCCSIVML